MWLSMFMDGSGKCKLPSIGLCNIKHLNMVIVKFEFITSADVFIRWLSWNLQCDTCAIPNILVKSRTPENNEMKIADSVWKMIGTLPETKKADWKSYVAPLVLAYNGNMLLTLYHFRKTSISSYRSFTRITFRQEHINIQKWICPWTKRNTFICLYKKQSKQQIKQQNMQYTYM